ncbi:MAG: hypothetical protein KA419_03585 [Acidobacteria bacterium]|nr:hypothetical protein [Acidobacteriota bacterium]
MSTAASTTRSDALDRAAEALLASPYTAALTGAGVSVESGLPDFRSADGLWTRYDPTVYAHIGGFHRHPEKIWTFVRELIVSFGDAAPNEGHRAMAALEEAGRLQTVVTQNIDNIEMNLEETSLTHSLTDIFIQGPFGRTMPELARRVLARA